MEGIEGNTLVRWNWWGEGEPVSRAYPKERRGAWRSWLARMACPKGRRQGRAEEGVAVAARAAGKRGEEPSAWVAQVGGGREDSGGGGAVAASVAEGEEAATSSGGRGAKWRRYWEDEWKSVKRYKHAVVDSVERLPLVKQNPRTGVQARVGENCRETWVGLQF